MSEQRTNDDKRLAVAAKVTLGGIEYDVYPLRRRANREWLKKAEAFTRHTMEMAQQRATSSGADLINGVCELMFRDPDAVEDLLLAYAPQLKEAMGLEGDSEPTDLEIYAAYQECWAMANPCRALANLEGMTRDLNTLKSMAGA